MPIKKSWLVLVLVLSSMVTIFCSLPIAAPMLSESTQALTPTAEKVLPQIIHYPPPSIEARFTAFKNAGCPLNENGFRVCREDSTLFQLGCGFLDEPSPETGALQPAVDIALCRLSIPYPDPMPEGLIYLYNWGCSLPMPMALAVFEDGKYRVLRTLEEMKEVFAPIESPAEALGYALAATGYDAIYDWAITPDFRYFTDQLEDTHVEEISGGYRVFLNEFPFCGCGPHTHYLRVVEVTPTGDLKVLDRQPLFEDPTQDGLCVD